MKIPEYDSLDATAMADLVRRGELTAAELLDAAIERIAARNPAINAVVSTFYDRARQRLADLPSDGPMYGVPFLVKDLKMQIAGTVTTNATRLLANRKAEQTSLLAQRYEDAGLVIVGKTNSPELGIMGVTEPALWGPCRNPWDTNHTSGGSSGGAAAAVAARIVPVAHGGDGGGSIRIPASACGMFGLKPTRGRVSMAPFRGEAWSGLVQEHVVARTVRDSALFLDIAAQPTPGEPYYAPAHAGSWRAHVDQPPGALTVAYTKKALLAGESDRDCVAAVEDAAALMESLGHTIEEVDLPFSRDEMAEAYFVTVASNIARFVEETAETAGKKPRSRDFEEATWLLAQIGWNTPAPRLLKVQHAIHQTTRAMAAFFAKYDVAMTSTMALPPVKVGTFDLSFTERAQLRLLRNAPLGVLLDAALQNLGSNALAATPNTQLFNMTGQPAMSVPLHWSPSGLPIGIQFAADAGREDLLLRLARQLEQARPWDNKRPPLVK
ncbi:MAG: amidase [Myxococcota bacterium]